MSPRNKLSAYYDRIWKTRGAAMQPGDDPDTSSVVWNSPLYMTNTVKWTSTVSSKLLVEGGYSEQHRAVQEPESAGHRAALGHRRMAGGRTLPRRHARDDESRDLECGSLGGGEYQKSPDRYNMQASASYVTGLAQHQGRLPGFVGAVDGSTLRAERRPRTRTTQNGAPVAAGAATVTANRDAVTGSER